MQAIHPITHTGDKKQSLYNPFAAYLHTVPLDELISSSSGDSSDASSEAVKQIDQYLNHYDRVYMGELRERILKLCNDMNALREELNEPR